MDKKTTVRRRRNSKGSPPNMHDEETIELLSNGSFGRSESDSEVRIVLLGKTGSGKSSTGNTILGRDALTVEASPQSVTTACQRAYRELGDRTVCVIDTPGLLDEHTSKTDIEAELIKALKLTYPGPHVFLLVLRLDVKFTEEEKKAVEWIEKNFGEKIRKYTIVLFTHGGKLKRKTVEEYLREGPELKKLVDRMADYHVFENENKDDGAQVTELLEKIDRIKKMPTKSQIYTRTMYERAQRELRNKHMMIAGVGGEAAGRGAVEAAAGGPTSRRIALIAAAATGGSTTSGIALGAAAAAAGVSTAVLVPVAATGGSVVAAAAAATGGSTTRRIALGAAAATAGVSTAVLVPVAATGGAVIAAAAAAAVTTKTAVVTAAGVIGGVVAGIAAAKTNK